MCNTFDVLNQKSGMGVACKALLQLQTELSRAPAVELEDTDCSAFDLPTDRGVGCYSQFINKENYRDVLVLKQQVPLFRISSFKNKYGI